MDSANTSGVSAGGSFDGFGSVTAGIGFKEDNPWSQPTTESYDLWVSQMKKHSANFAEQLSSYGTDDKWTTSGASKPSSGTVK